MTSPSQGSTGPTAAEFALASEIVSLEHHVAAGGWDAPIRVFALVRTADALVDTPSLAEETPPEAVRLAKEDPHALLAIEQEGLPQAPNLETLLASLAWPETVHGVAIAVEQFAFPPAAEAGGRHASASRVPALRAPPAADARRIVAGVLRAGAACCAVRDRGSG